jgi:hypothetical protein
MASVSKSSVPRYVGAAFVFQFCTSLAAGLMSTSLLSGDVSDVIGAAGADAARLRVIILLELATSVGIIALTSLLFVALQDTVRWVATVAFALWLAEATVLAVSMLGLYELLGLGARSSSPGSSLAASDAAVGDFALGLHDHAATIAMLFASVGALLWYSLFIRTRFVPRWLGVWGLASIALVGIATLLDVWDADLQPSMLLYVAYMPFEFVVGVWLLTKGSPVQSATTGGTRLEDLSSTEVRAAGAADANAEGMTSA